MNDYIKAIRLADGFDLTEDQLTFPSGHYFTVKSADHIVPWMLDALAAQLVRQVDALEVYGLWVTDEGVTVWSESEDTPYGPARTFAAQIEGDDRTMNTIKAIVDSGVLK